LAVSPISISESVKAIYEGVLLSPMSFGIMSTFPFCHTPIYEYDVPKSIPIAGAFLIC